MGVAGKEGRVLISTMCFCVVVFGGCERGAGVERGHERGREGEGGRGGGLDRHRNVLDGCPSTTLAGLEEKREGAPPRSSVGMDSAGSVSW